MHEATDSALRLSKITAPGSVPFRLKAVVLEPGKKDSEYRAEIEESWFAPDKFRRTVKSPGFSQTVIVNGDQVFEEDSGNYYPFWLRNLVSALFDVVPDDFSPHDPQQNTASTDPLKVPLDLGGPPVASGPYTRSCTRWEDKLQIASTAYPVFSTLCFQGEPSLFSALFTPYFHAQFQDYKEFGHKQVARKITIQPAAGRVVEARILELKQIHENELSLSLPQSAPMKERIRSVRVNQQEALNMLLNSAAIQWEPVHEGPTTGNMAMALYVDNAGMVREVWPLHSDNPALQQQAIKQVLNWRFKPLEQGGFPVQMESLFGFHFETSLENPIPLLSDAEGRKLAVTKAEPHFVQTRFTKGTEFTVRITVDEHGKLVRVENFKKIDPALFGAAEGALGLWEFKPYKKDGKPVRCNADITFHVD